MSQKISQVSFVIPCSTMQAEVVLASLSTGSELVEAIVCDSFPDIPLPLPAEVDGWSFNTQVAADGILLTGDDVDTDELAVFTQAALKHFDLADIIVVEAGDGAKGVITKTESSWCCPANFVAQGHEAHARGMHYYYCTVTEVVDGLEYDNAILMECLPIEDADERLAKVAADIRSGYDSGDDDDGGGDDGDGGSAAVSEALLHKRRIPVSEFNTMKKYVPVQ